LGRVPKAEVRVVRILRPPLFWAVCTAVAMVAKAPLPRRYAAISCHGACTTAPRLVAAEDRAAAALDLFFEFSHSRLQLFDERLLAENDLNQLRLR